MTEIEPIWWLRIFMAALLLGMGIFAWCEISKAMAVKRHYAHRRKVFDAQLAAVLLIAAVVSTEKSKEPPNEEKVQ